MTSSRASTSSSLAGSAIKASEIVAHKIPALQYLRGVAIVLVLCQHLSISATVFEKWFGTRFSLPFYSGVELFFVISGLVVTKSLIKSQFGVRRYLVRRLFRLYPALLAAIGISAFMSFLANSDRFPPFVHSLFGGDGFDFALQSGRILLGVALGHTSFYCYGAMWTLSVEFEFYAVLALIVVLAKCLKVDADTLRGSLFLIVSGFLIFSIARRIGVTAGFPLTGWPAYLLQYKFDFIGAGVFLALLPTRITNRLRRPNAFVLSMLCVAVGLVLLACVRGPLQLADSHDLLEGIVMVLLMFLYTSAVGLASGSESYHGRNVISCLMNWFGERSYSLYLLHFACFCLAWFIARWHIPWVLENAVYYGIYQVLVGVSLSCLASECLYRFVEQPGIMLGSLICGRFVQDRLPVMLRNCNERCHSAIEGCEPGI